MSEPMWLHDTLDYWARDTPELEFVVHGDGGLTYGQAAAFVERIAGALVGRLDRNERFAVLSRNCVEMILLYYAGSKAGVVPVPLNYRLAPAELAYILVDSGASVIFASSEYRQVIDSLRPELPRLSETVGIGRSSPGWTGLEDWCGAPIGAGTARRRRNEDVLQVYTSGTTGRPKGAVLTQAGLFALLYQWRICLPMSVGERLLLAAPLYHVGGAFHALHAAGHGGSLYLFTDFSADEVVRALDEEQIGIAFLVPAMIQACLAVEGATSRKYEAFRLLSYGASAISESTLRLALETWGCDFVQSFGMTECACVSYLTPQDHRRALGGESRLLEATGRAGPGSEIRVVDAEGQDLPPGSIGEILGRGPQMMRGYWNMPEATDEALAGGWMHTGDAGLLDVEGYLYVKDRIKDMIVSGAENIYPREVENVLLEHPAVVDAAVIGVPSEEWGETVKAIVVAGPRTSVTEADLMAHCRDRIAGFKCPRSVDFVDELPRNPSGKVLKRVLREPFWEGHSRRVS